MVTNEFNQDNLQPGTGPVGDTAFDVKYEDGHIKITPGAVPLHLFSGGIYAQQILEPSSAPKWDGMVPPVKITPETEPLQLFSLWRPIPPIKEAGMIAPVSDSSLSSSYSLQSITFTQDDRNRMIHIEQQLEELGNNVKLLLNRK
jgi:hypothetical protein